MSCCILRFLVLASTGLCLQQSAVEERLSDPAGHSIDVHALPWSTDLAPDVDVVEADPPKPEMCEQLTGSETATAYVAVCSDTRIEYVYFDQNGKTYRIEGVPLEHRPISGVAWASPRYLVFDRWSQPHYGMHYVVDTEQLCLVHACPFPDQFFLDQQRQASETAE